MIFKIYLISVMYAGIFPPNFVSLAFIITETSSFKQTNRQADRELERLTGRHTDGQRDWHLIIY